MRFIVYFLIFLYFAELNDSFFIGLIAAIGASYLWRYISNRNRQSNTAGQRPWGEASWGGGARQSSTSYDFGKGHIRSAIFPKQIFTPISFYVASLFVCLGRIAKAKGVVIERDIDLANGVMDKLQLPEALRVEARKYFNQGKDSTFSIPLLVSEVKKQFIAFPNFQRMFFDICLSAAILDGRIILSEKAIIRDLFPLTGARPELFDNFISQFEQGSGFSDRQQSAGAGFGGRTGQGQSYGSGSQEQGWGRATKSKLAESLATLGVTEDVEQDELKRVYRRLINQYHPDKLAGQNLPEGLIEMAKEKTQQIITAYNYINEYKGWSR
ncbi:MAG: co-chaperone DjlA [Alcaligenaceae bacterium]|nr:co-chaperone DjlA [Alcaligenaceae bacterium]